MSDGTFYGYIFLLALSGIILSVLAVGGFGQSVLARVLDAIFGVIFLGYAFYLLFFFDGGEVRILFYAFVVPIFAIVQVVKARKARSEQASAAAFPPHTPGPQAPGYPAPGYPAQGYPAPGQQAPGQPYGQPAGHGQADAPQAPPHQ